MLYVKDVEGVLTRCSLKSNPVCAEYVYGRGMAKFSMGTCRDISCMRTG